jgi:hypothetical protein
MIEVAVSLEKCVKFEEATDWSQLPTGALLVLAYGVTLAEFPAGKWVWVRKGAAAVDHGTRGSVSDGKAVSS